MKQFKLNFGTQPFMTKDERAAIDRRKDRQVNRVHKRFKSNTEHHHRLQDLSGGPVPRPQFEDDEMIGNDDQRKVYRNEF